MTYDVCIDSTKGVRIDSGDAFTDVVCQENGGFRVRSAEKNNLGLHSRYFTVTKDEVEASGTFVSNWAGANTFAGLLHHRYVGGEEYIAGFGIGEIDGNPSASMELSSVTGVRVARLDVYSTATDRVSLRLEGQGGYTTHLMVNNGVLYVGGKKIAFA